MIELRGVTKRFGTTLAVRNLNFTCHEGEFLVLFGPAGAGKSTTLRLIAGITEPSYGEIFLLGESLNGVPPERRNFSMVFENYALYSHLTVFENLAFPLRARGMPDAEVRRRVQEMAALLHIEGMTDRKPGYLSGGQRQRVALGRGLIRDAEIYLLDEPISHLDARLRIQMRAELKNMCLEKHRTVIHVTHDYKEAMALADRVIVLNKGRIMQDAAPEEVYHCPANDFVASFVGDPPMSFIKVSYREGEGGPAFILPEAGIVLRAAKDFGGRAAEKARTGSEIKLGLRSNQVSLFTTADQLNCYEARVYLVEAQGHRNLVTVDFQDNLVQISTSPETTWQVGQQVWIGLDPRFFHVFVDGRAVYHPDRNIVFSSIA